MEQVISLEEWLTLPRDVLATVVAQHKLTVKVALDGSTRHYLLRHPNEQGVVLDVEEYFRDGFARVLGLIELLFSSGVQNLVLLAFWPGDLERRENHLHRIVGNSKQLLLSENAIALFKRLELRVALYGDYEISPILAPVRDEILSIREGLAAATNEGNRLLLWGYTSKEGLDEVIARSVQLYQTLGRQPTEAEVRQASFPLGPEKLDIFIGSGWLRVDNSSLPSLLNRGDVDIYCLSHLPLDLTEGEARRILYDRIFRRQVSSVADDVKYTPEILAPLRNYYTEHAECVLGLGHLVGGRFWYPDHLEA